MAHGSAFRYVLSPPHPAARPFLVIGAIVVLAGLIVASWLAWIGRRLILFCLYFFRDPERFPPPRPNALLAPADGHIVSVVLAAPPPELGLGVMLRWRVAIFLSVLDVHVNRMPADGTVTRIAYRHGKFLSANLDKSSDENERNALAIRLPDGREIAVVQIAGLIARRHPLRREGGRSCPGRRPVRHHPLRQPHRHLFAGGRAPLVAEGQIMIGGESVIAELSDEPEPEQPPELDPEMM